MNVDYIIVGFGLAGLSFVEHLERNNKSFVVFEDQSQTSSLVAGGVYNPVVLKRFTPVWNAKEQLAYALPFYESIEDKLSINIDHKFTTKKVFKSIEDENNWFSALDKPFLSDTLDANIDRAAYNGVISPLGFGNVKGTGRIDTKKLVESYRSYLKFTHRIFTDRFVYDNLSFSDNVISYQDIKATNIVFCEGFGVVKNPFFNYLPLKEAKGELITIYAPDLTIDFLLKSSLFVLPLGNSLYKVGATFNWKDKTSIPTKEGELELVEKLKKVINVPYKIVDKTAGIRPTVKDRRPLVGRHPIYKNAHVLNGLGTRGVMIAPIAAKALFDSIVYDKNINPDMNISRFKDLFIKHIL